MILLTELIQMMLFNPCPLVHVEKLQSQTKVKILPNKALMNQRSNRACVPYCLLWIIVDPNLDFPRIQVLILVLSLKVRSLNTLRKSPGKEGMSTYTWLSQYRSSKKMNTFFPMKESSFLTTTWFDIANWAFKSPPKGKYNHYNF